LSAGLLGMIGPAAAHADTGADTVVLDARIPNVERVVVERRTDGDFVYHVRMRGGEERILAPDAFAALVHDVETGTPVWQRVLNVRSPIGVAWVTLGLIGQLAFMTRMLYQWLVSERHGRSVVPVAFWWISIAGASMLLVYFVWRRDVVGVLGQSMGFLVYGRNLWLIHRGREPSVSG